MAVSPDLFLVGIELLGKLELLLALPLLRQFDLLDLALQHLGLLDGSLPVLALAQQLLDKRLREVLGLRVLIYRQGDFGDGDLANLQVV